MTIHLTIPSSPPSRLPTSSSFPFQYQEASLEEEEYAEKQREGLRAVSTAIRSAKRIVVLSGLFSISLRLPHTLSSKLISFLCSFLRRCWHLCRSRDTGLPLLNRSLPLPRRFVLGGEQESWSDEWEGAL